MHVYERAQSIKHGATLAKQHPNTQSKQLATKLAKSVLSDASGGKQPVADDVIIRTMDRNRMRQISEAPVTGLCFACDFVTFRALEDAPKIELFRML